MVIGAVSRCRSRSWRRRAIALVLSVVVVFAAAAVVAVGRPIRVLRRPGAATHVRRLDSASSLMLARTNTWPAAGGGDNDDVIQRRRLIGPGSLPPTCRARCGRCTPCRPVHVTIQPGVGAQWEYYPEVWRCKCGNKLFMP